MDWFSLVGLWNTGLEIPTYPPPSPLPLESTKKLGSGFFLSLFHLANSYLTFPRKFYKWLCSFQFPCVCIKKIKPFMCYLCFRLNFSTHNLFLKCCRSSFAWQCFLLKMKCFVTGLDLNLAYFIKISLTPAVKHEQHPFLLVLHFLSASIVVMPTNKSFSRYTIFQNCNFTFCCCLKAIFCVDFDFKGMFFVFVLSWF